MIDKIDHLSQNWQNELLTLSFKGVAFLVLVIAGDLIISDYKKPSENLTDSLLPEIESKT